MRKEVKLYVVCKLVGTEYIRHRVWSSFSAVVEKRPTDVPRSTGRSTPARSRFPEPAACTCARNSRVAWHYWPIFVASETARSSCHGFEPVETGTQGSSGDQRLDGSGWRTTSTSVDLVLDSLPLNFQSGGDRGPDRRLANLLHFTAALQPIPNELSILITILQLSWLMHYWIFLCVFIVSWT